MRQRIEPAVHPSRVFWVALGEVDLENMVLLADQALLAEMMVIQMEGLGMDVGSRHHYLPLLLYHLAISKLTLPRSLMAEGGQGRQNGWMSWNCG